MKIRNAHTAVLHLPHVGPFAGQSLTPGDNEVSTAYLGALETNEQVHAWFRLGWLVAVFAEQPAETERPADPPVLLPTAPVQDKPRDDWGLPLKDALPAQIEQPAPTTDDPPSADQLPPPPSGGESDK